MENGVVGCINIVVASNTGVHNCPSEVIGSHNVTSELTAIYVC